MIELHKKVKKVSGGNKEIPINNSVQT